MLEAIFGFLAAALLIGCMIAAILMLIIICIETFNDLNDRRNKK